MSLFFNIATNNKNYIHKRLSLDPSLINKTDNFGRSNLYYSIAYGDIYMLKIIMSFNPNINLKDIFGLSAIDYAYFYNKKNYIDIIDPTFEKNENNMDSIKQNIENIINFYGEDFLRTLHTRDERDD
jgi:ankyrin repeat protein